MAFENRGQYHFLPDESGEFKIAKQPLGITPGPRFGIANLLGRFIGRHDDCLSALGVIGTLDNAPYPTTDEEMNLLGDILLSDLRKKGILDIIARETNVEPGRWYHHGKKVGPSKSEDPNIWDIDIMNPEFRYSSSPSGYSRWSEQGCTRVTTIARNKLDIEIIRGAEGKEENVMLSYDRSGFLEVDAGSWSKVNTSLPGSKYLFQEHLRDALDNPKPIHRVLKSPDSRQSSFKFPQKFTSNGYVYI